MRAPGPCRWLSRLPPCSPASPFVSVSPPVATPTTPTIGRAGKRTRSFISDPAVLDPEEPRERRPHLVDQLPVAGDQRRDAPLDRLDREELDDERVARLGARDGDGPGGAVDAVEVDLRDEVVLGADLPAEAVVRLEADDGAGLDLEHRLEVGPERPDDLVARDDVVDGRAAVVISFAGRCGGARRPARADDLLLDEDPVGALERLAPLRRRRTR